MIFLVFYYGFLVFLFLNRGGFYLSHSCFIRPFVLAIYPKLQSSATFEEFVFFFDVYLLSEIQNKHMELLFEQQTKLINRFDLYKTHGRIDNEVIYHTFPFESHFEEPEVFSAEKDRGSDCVGSSDLMGVNTQVNRWFRYAVFEAEDRQEESNAIMLLHGLNERKWDKYLLWAYHLAKSTRAPIILFPLANHMNRSSENWSFPRQMIKVVRSRKEYYGPIENSSFVNVALSQRIDLCPELFLSSGVQSILDIMKVTSEIKSGMHPLFSKGKEVDFFSYSIGAFVTELLLMANPGDLYNHSKAFLFCGGATFDQMNGRSKNILDNRAFESLQGFVNNFDVGKVSNKFFDVFKPFGSAVRDMFLSMISMEKYKRERESRLEALSSRMRAIGLNMDKVVPGSAIFNTFCMGKCQNVSVVDFDFGYSHEMPFPIHNTSIAGKVENAFKNVFNEASCFLKR